MLYMLNVIKKNFFLQIFQVMQRTEALLYARAFVPISSKLIIRGI